MATQLDMKNRIVLELGGRSDLLANGAIANAISTAITEYQTERFRFNETGPLTPFTFDMVPQQPFYDKNSVPTIGLLMRVDWITVVIGNVNEVVEQVEPLEIYTYLQSNNSMQGFPSSFAIDGNALAFAPSPDKVYTLTVGAFLAAAAPANDAEVGNPWMNEAELLIRSRAKFELATHQTRNAEMAQAMSPRVPTENGGVVGAAYGAWTNLKGQTNRFTSKGGRVRAVRF